MPLQRNIVFDKDYGKLVEQGTLTMDSGEIKNTGDGYSIKDNGIEVRLSSGGSLDRDRAYALVDGSGNVKGYLWGTTLDDSIRLVSEDNLVMESKDGDILIGSNNNTILQNFNGDVILQSLPDFDPGISGAIYRSGNDLKISTG